MISTAVAALGRQPNLAASAADESNAKLDISVLVAEIAAHFA
jgi:hypothetical protein